MERPSVFQMMDEFMIDRPVMAEANTDNGFLFSYLAHEVNEELRDEMEAVLRGEDRKEEAALEAVDVVWLGCQIIRNLGFDPEAMIRDKAAYNHLQHQSKYYQGAYTFDAARKLAKGDAYRSGTKQAYYLR